MAAAEAAHEVMQAACTAEQPAAALVNHAHQPTDPVTPDTNPDADIQVTYPALQPV